MTTLFKLQGIIEIVNKAAKEALKETSEEGEQTQSKLSKAFSAIGKGAVALGKTVAAGLAVTGSAVVALTTKAITAYADYEQLTGGIETLFGTGGRSLEEYAASVGKSVDEAAADYQKLQNAQEIMSANAAKAYMSAGMSANEYMETVTGFSASLIASMSGDTEKAAQKANMALVDMSDNANKLGSDMESIKNAYSGFAKQNYTMLDNLKLGYGGTKAEMERLLADAQSFSGIEYDIESYADIVDAIHVVQTEMDITGTTAKEASTTISGSIGSAKAAWQNLLTGIADGNQDIGPLVTNLFESLSTVADNIVPRIEQSLQTIPQVVTNIAPNLMSKAVELIETLLPAVINGAVSLFNAAVEVLPQLFSGIWNLLPSLLTQIGQLLANLATFITENLPVLTSKAKELMSGLGEKIRENMPEVISTALDILMGLSEAILENLPQLAATGMDLVISLIGGILDSLPQLLSQAPVIISNFARSISESFETIFKKGFELLWEIIKGLIAAIPDLISNLPLIINAIIDVWNAINWINLGKTLVVGIKNGLTSMAKGLHTTAQNLFGQLKTKVATIFDGIKLAITQPIVAAKTLLYNIIMFIGRTVPDTFGALKNKVASIFLGIKSAITSPISSAKELIGGIIDVIKKLFLGIDISFPAIKLPHFSITPKGWKIGDLLQGSLPKLGIDWYAKAMNNPIVMTTPTIFGYDSKTGKALGGGEAGSEVVSGTDTLMSMIESAVENKTSVALETVITVLTAILNAILTGNDDILSTLLNGQTVKIGEREFARLVRETLKGEK